MTQLKPTSAFDLLVLFGAPTVLNLIACRVLIPLLHASFGVVIEAAYFLSVGVGVLLPMFLWAIWLTAKETQSYRLRDLLARMRIRRLSRGDWWWTALGFVGLCIASFLIAKVLMPWLGMDATPFFFQNMPLTSDHRWLLFVWPLFFFFNVFGEELLWRGYILPRQEKAAGRHAWLLHGALWAVWHVPMGFDLIVAALPIFVILPAIVQLRKNTTIAIVVHAVFGGFGFLALALGGVQ